MKTQLFIGCMTLSAAMLLLNGCKKSENSKNPNTSSATPVALHGMGLNPATPEELASVPAFTTSLFAHKLETDGLTYNGTRYTSYMLKHPQIRDQGQIGACTCFCGATADEILYYYKNNTVTPVENFTTANAISEAHGNRHPKHVGRTCLRQRKYRCRLLLARCSYILLNV